MKMLTKLSTVRTIFIVPNGYLLGKPVAILCLAVLCPFSILGQVTIRERITITPRTHSPSQDTSAGSHRTGFVDSSAIPSGPEIKRSWGRPHVLGIPLEQWINSHTDSSHPVILPRANKSGISSRGIESIRADSTWLCGETIAVINPSEIYYHLTYEYQTFFDTSGTFDIPAIDGYGVLLRGGLVYHNDYGSNCCIGADDRLIVTINGVEAINYDLGTSLFALIDPNNVGIDLSSLTHPGTNSYHIIAVDTHGDKQWLTPLSLESESEPKHLSLNIPLPNLKHGWDTGISPFATDECGNQRSIDSSTLVTFEAISDSLYGHFHNRAGQRLTNPVTVSWISAYYGDVFYIADGVQPDTIRPVAIRVTVQDPRLSPSEVEGTIYVNHADDGIVPFLVELQAIAF